MIKDAVKSLINVEVDCFEKLLVDYAKEKNARAIIRGLRATSDFEYEFQMALTNRKLASDIETIFLMPSEQYSYMSSTLIKEAASLGADLSDFVPDFVGAALKKKFKK